MCPASDSPLFNEARAVAFASQCENPSTRQMIENALACAKLRVVRRVGQTEEDWRATLPAFPVDLLFLAEVLEDSMREPWIRDS